MPLISVLIIYMGPVSIHVKSYILGLYACKSFYPCLFKNSYAIKCFLYVGLNFHLGKRLPWRKIIICKALKKKTKHECFLCKKKSWSRKLSLWYNTIFETLKLLVMGSCFLWNETSSCIFESFIIRFFGIACLLQLNV